MKRVHDGPTPLGALSGTRQGDARQDELDVLERMYAHSRRAGAPRQPRPPSTPRGAFVGAILGLAIGAGLFIVGLFFLPHAHWPGLVKVLWLLISGVATVGALWSSLTAFLRLPGRDRALILILVVALGGLGGSLETVRSWAAILGYKLEESAAVARAAWESWWVRGDVYLLAEDEHGVSRLLPIEDGGVIAVSAFDVQRVTLTGEGTIRKEPLLGRDDFQRAGIALTPLTGCARAPGRLLCMNLFGEVIERRGGSWRKLAAFPAPRDQYYDALAVDPATGALFAWTGRGQRPRPEYRGLWRLNPATGEAERLAEWAPRDLVASDHGVWALYPKGLKPLTPGAPAIDIDMRRYGGARRAAVDRRGRLLVATGQAVLRVQEDGTVEPIWHEGGAEYDVRGVTLASDGRPVLATWEDGLALDPGTGGLVPFGIRERFLWTHLRDVASGPAGWIWVAASGPDLGLVALRWPAFVRFVQTHRATGAPEGVLQFADLQEAVAALYPDGLPAGSGALSPATPALAEGRLIAWHGEPVWPRHLAALPYHRHPLGAIPSPGRHALALDPGRVAVVEGDRRRELALPPGRRVLRVLLDRSGRLWVGTREGALHEDAPGALTQVPGLPARRVADMAEDRRGRIWVAFSARNDAGKHVPGRLFLGENRVWRELHVDQARLRRYRGGSTGRGSRPSCDLLLSTDVNDIEPLHDGRVALGTDMGLVLHDGHAARCFGPSEGLPGGAVERVREDARGRLFFFSFGDQLAWFDGRLAIYHTIRRERGLFRRDPVDAWTDPQERLWVLDEEGAVAVAPIRQLY